MQQKQHINIDDCWQVIAAELDHNGRVRHQLQSMNDFYEGDISEIFLDDPSLVFVTQYVYSQDTSKPPPDPTSQEARREYVLSKATHMIQVYRPTGEIKVGYPTVTTSENDPRPISPQEARVGRMNYAGPLTLAFWCERYAYNAQLFPDAIPIDRDIERHCVGMLPIAVGSVRCWTQHPTQSKSRRGMRECELDEGGYFIVNGIEKSIVQQDHMRSNIVNVFTRKIAAKEFLVAEIRSARSRVRGADSALKFLTPRGLSSLQPTEVTCRINYVKGDIPAFVLFRALGFDDDQVLLTIVACFFYETQDPGLALARLANQDDEIDIRLNSILRQCIETSRLRAPTVKDAKLFIADRTTSQHGFESSTSAPHQSEELRLRSAEQVLTRDVLPHMTPPELLRSHSLFAAAAGESAYKQDAETAKAKLLVMIGQVFTRLLRVQLGLDRENDRDHNGHKRFCTAGALFSQLLSQHLYKCIREARRYLTRLAKLGRDLSLARALKTKMITHGIFAAISTGNWPNQRAMGHTNTGISQTLNRMNYTSTISQFRRANTPIDKSNSRVISPRLLHTTSIGTICPVETPEGEPAGLVKNMALIPTITAYHDTGPLRALILSEPLMLPLHSLYDAINLHHVSVPPSKNGGDGLMGPPPAKRSKVRESESESESVTVDVYDGATRVFLNGEWLGYHKNGAALHKELKLMRRRDDISHETAIIYPGADPARPILQLSMEAGRASEPLFVVGPDNQLLFRKRHLRLLKQRGWKVLIEEGVVEYVDTAEKQFCLVAEFRTRLREPGAPRYTHCQIDPSTIYGASACQIVFLNSNQAPRNTYQSAMGKQSIPGLACLSQNVRFDSVQFGLWYPQKPLVTTRGGQLIMLNDLLSAGTNVVLAVMCHTGYNMEDSIIVNQSSVDRGLFRTTLYRTHSADTRKQASGQFETFEKPCEEDTANMKQADYGLLDIDGLPAPGATICDGNVIVGKTQTPSTTGTRLAREKQKKRQLQRVKAASTFNTGNVMPDAEEEEDSRKNDRSQTWNNEGTSRIVCVATGNTPQGGQYARIKTSQMHVPDVGDKFCLTSDHEVLTSTGWKPIAEVTEDDLVATLVDAETVRYDRPTSVYSYEHTGEPIFDVAHGEGFSLAVTLGHRMYVASTLCRERFGLAYASDVAQSMCIYKHDARAGLGCQLGVAEIYSDSSIAVRLDQERFCITLISQEAKAVAFDSRYWFSQVGRYLATGECDISSIASTIPEPTRRVPAWILQLGASQAGLVLQAFRLANVKWLGSPDDVQRLELHAGSSTVRVTQVDHAKQAHISNSYVGSVHCVEVGSHVFYVRRKGAAIGCWTGNSSRHGQKGTIGRLIRQEDMPFTCDGIVPDIILNPHAFPGRMTIGKLKEMTAALVRTLTGYVQDGTPHIEYDEDPNTVLDERNIMERLFDMLHAAGLQREGNQRMYCGYTGVMLESSIFIAPCFYQPLKHLADKKLYARARSRRQVVTRQPTDGRAREGGLRLGEMERDTFIAHGTPHTQVDRMHLNSDTVTFPVCDDCGQIAIEEAHVDEETGQEYRLSRCPEHVQSATSLCCAPNAAKLLAQEMDGFGVRMAFRLDGVKPKMV